MVVVNTVEKFGVDDFLDRSWDLPSEVTEPLRAHVEVTPDGWVVDVWPMTAQLAVIVQPWLMSPSVSSRVPGSSALPRSLLEASHRCHQSQMMAAIRLAGRVLPEPVPLLCDAVHLARRRRAD
ncbi:hypothetical protein [Micromonospora sp. SH-82]|uniref:hypothetical protein n=1 Tax=Micromonospora sp. SH-82 TaxID=3132938 RepID=UPI003EB96BEF